ncbi:MAG: TRAP transporter substrate-binding protein DctP [Oligoflexia bacterium]|nr:TRAP transporter substrate-binding protein DctP [Oligoflexia bacterium]
MPVRLLLMCLCFSGVLNAKTYIKFAVLAPEGSTWVNMLKEYNEQLIKDSRDKLELKIYPSGISGDEFDVIRKMKIGKIHSAGFTGNGLGQILPELRVLELPLLFSSYEETDYVTGKLKTHFEQQFAKKGYILLGWAEVGFVNLFSNTKLDSLKALEGIKMWAWEGDPLARELFCQLKIVPYPMPLTDVYTSLQTGLINAFYVSPLAAIAMQWFTKTKYMTTLKLTNATGAVLMSKKKFDKLKPDEQKLLKDSFWKFCQNLIKASRKDNEKSYETLKKNKITFVDLNKDDYVKFEEISKKVWNALAGKLYSKKLLEEVLKYREEFRTVVNNDKAAKKSDKN